MSRFVEPSASVRQVLKHRLQAGVSVEKVSQTSGLPMSYIRQLVKKEPPVKEPPEPPKKMRPLLKADIQKRLRNAAGFYESKPRDPNRKTYMAVEKLVLQQIRSGRLTISQAEEHLSALFQGIFE